jgi:hypothetical protein
VINEKRPVASLLAGAAVPHRWSIGDVHDHGEGERHASIQKAATRPAWPHDVGLPGGRPLRRGGQRAVGTS